MNTTDFDKIAKEKQLDTRQIAWQKARNEFYSYLQNVGRQLHGMRMHLDAANPAAVTLAGHERDYTQKAMGYESAQTLYNTEIVPLDTAIKIARVNQNADDLDNKLVQAEVLIGLMKSFQ